MEGLWRGLSYNDIARQPAYFLKYQAIPLSQLFTRNPQRKNIVILWQLKMRSFRTATRLSGEIVFSKFSFYQKVAAQVRTDTNLRKKLMHSEFCGLKQWIWTNCFQNCIQLFRVYVPWKHFVSVALLYKSHFFPHYISFSSKIVPPQLEKNEENALNQYIYLTWGRHIVVL